MLARVHPRQACRRSTFRAHHPPCLPTPACLPAPPPQFLSKLVNLQGIVTRCTLVRPKIVKSVHYCPATGQFQSREYRDVTANSGAPTSTAYPTK